MQGHISGSFASSQKAAPPPMQHPEAKAILQSAKDILNKTPTGKHLVEVLEEYSVPAFVMPGREITYTCPDESSIYLMVTPSYKKSAEIVAMTLAVAIRDVEHFIAGYKRPNQETDPADYAEHVFTKSLDIIRYMCIIADELKENLGYTKALDFIFDLGHRDLYEAYKANASFEEFAQVFSKEPDEK